MRLSSDQCANECSNNLKYCSYEPTGHISSFELNCVEVSQAAGGRFRKWRKPNPSTENEHSAELASRIRMSHQHCRESLENTGSFPWKRWRASSHQYLQLRRCLRCGSRDIVAIRRGRYSARPCRPRAAQESRGRATETHRHDVLDRDGNPLINSDQVLSAETPGAGKESDRPGD